MAVTKSKLVVVGNGMVGHHFIEQLCSLGLNKQFDVHVFGEEPRPAYDRVQLSKYFETGTADSLMLTSAQDYADWGINLHLNTQITAIDIATKTLTSAKGEQYQYDRLVLSTGSFPFVPPIKGNDRQQCLVYRTIEDLQDIQAAANNSKVGVVVGGGLLGLEAANAMMQLGVKTHVVEFAPQLMPVQLNDKAGDLLCSKIEQLGVSVHTSKATTAIIDGETALHRMTFSDESYLEADMIVFSAGIRPQDALARVSNINIGERGGIEIDDYCLTSAPDVYAIGECALWQQKIFGLVAPGYQMARVAASHIAASVSILEPKNKAASFTGADMSTKLKLLGVDVAAIGASRGFDNAQFVELSDNQAGIYKKLWLDETGKFLKGAVLVGDNSDYSRLLEAYLSQDEIIGSAVELLLAGAESEADLKDTSIVCSCHQVTKGDIVDAVKAGNHKMAEIKSCTRAASGCGGCAPMVQKIIDQTLQAQGLDFNAGICAHFDHDRQALYHLCQVEGINDFETLMTLHGKPSPQGHTYGCDICKPAAASIFASLQNQYVLNQDNSHVQLQDTNDAFLGNLQKDGSYSIVPRIAGGEITPAKLIAMGQIAQDYDLYTKITGGQRIDMFGAQLSQLPEIWQKLIDAGFETGHAYGKSLRTVKSCVGNTWCRYGVQDAIGLAIDLENRYKGLRSPHKLKFAVSGCTRECAEAQSKDIGVIATDKGWNLYVAGNGGMRPRHGDLFATDLSTAELYQYIDRVLMFYVKTADKLQRTSTWMDSLEGGLGYLKSVVIDDALGLNTELEKQMDSIVASYQCEWKTSLEQPSFLSRFNEFVNPADAPKADTSAYQRIREQRFPAIKDAGAGIIAIRDITDVQTNDITEEVVA
ncbi:nitrite reductase large subunit NirB [Shewanella sp. HL-SH5]|uniref:nitrite reductase large subunit NirB n=1 Tax=Shewanella sp. HL-SH5 TaxID=3436241 RepID=UPI003EB823AD